MFSDASSWASDVTMVVGFFFLGPKKMDQAPPRCPGVRMTRGVGPAPFGRCVGRYLGEMGDFSPSSNFFFVFLVDAPWRRRRSVQPPKKMVGRAGLAHRLAQSTRKTMSPRAWLRAGWLERKNISSPMAA